MKLLFSSRSTVTYCPLTEEETVYGEGIFLQISFMSRENVTIASVFQFAY